MWERIFFQEGTAVISNRRNNLHSYIKCIVHAIRNDYATLLDEYYIQTGQERDQSFFKLVRKEVILGTGRRMPG